MEGPRASKTEELQSVIGLINDVFRINDNCLPTMEKEFPLLLCESNADNIRVIVENEQVVSVINYYQSKVLIEGCPVKSASIGAVCTHPKYRGKNYASIILDDVENRLLENGTDIMFVSGERSLYTRRGCVKVGGFNEVLMTSNKSSYTETELIDYEDKYFTDMVRLYNMDSTRFYRSNFEFINILKGSTVSWGKHSYRVFLIKHMGNLEGYIILEISNNNGLHGSVVEYAGSRDLICMALQKIINICGLSDIAIVTPIHDVINLHLRNDGHLVNKADQLGTIKIINFVSFMNKLKPYFLQYLPNDMVENLSFGQEDNTYIIKVEDQELRIQGVNAMSQIIFGNAAGGDSVLSILKNLENKPSINMFIKTVFPLPIPWVGNLNYI